MFVETFQYLVLHKHFGFLAGFLVPCNVCPSAYCTLRNEMERNEMKRNEMERTK